MSTHNELPDCVFPLSLEATLRVTESMVQKFCLSVSLLYIGHMLKLAKNDEEKIEIRDLLLSMWRKSVESQIEREIAQTDKILSKKDVNVDFKNRLESFLPKYKQECQRIKALLEANFKDIITSLALGKTPTNTPLITINDGTLFGIASKS